MWLAFITHWLASLPPKVAAAVFPVLALLYSFTPPALVVDEAAFARPPPVVTS